MSSLNQKCFYFVVVLNWLFASVFVEAATYFFSNGAKLTYEFQGSSLSGVAYFKSADSNLSIPITKVGANFFQVTRNDTDLTEEDGRLVKILTPTPLVLSIEEPLQMKLDSFYDERDKKSEAASFLVDNTLTTVLQDGKVIRFNAARALLENYKESLPVDKISHYSFFAWNRWHQIVSIRPTNGKNNLTLLLSFDGGVGKVHVVDDVFYDFDYVGVDRSEENFPIIEILYYESGVVFLMTDSENEYVHTPLGDVVDPNRKQVEFSASESSSNEHVLTYFDSRKDSPLPMKTSKMRASLALSVVDKSNSTFVKLQSELAKVTISDNGGDKAPLMDVLNLGFDVLDPSQFETRSIIDFPKSDFDPILDQLNRKTSASIVLIGQSGGGKSALKNSFIRSYFENKFSFLPEDVVILESSRSRLLAGTMYTGTDETKVQALLELCKHKTVYLFLGEIHSFVGAGTHESNPVDFFNVLKDPLADGRLRIIGDTTTEEYHKYIAYDAANQRRFPPYKVKEIKVKEIPNKLIGFAKSYDLPVLSEKMRKLITQLAVEYGSSEAHISNAVDLYDRVVSAMKRLSLKVGTLKEDLVYKIASQSYNIDIAYFQPEKRLKLVDDFQKTLDKLYVGQDNLKKLLFQSFKAAMYRVNDRTKPGGRYLFAGAEGMGKSYLAKSFAKASGRPFALISLPEFNTNNGVDDLKVAIAEKIRENPTTVLFFDEIEKAAPDVLGALLAFLENDFLIVPKYDPNRQGRVLGFTKVKTNNTFVFAATNAGASYMRELYEKRERLGFGQSNDENVGKTTFDWEVFAKKILSEVEEGGSDNLRYVINRLIVAPIFPPKDRKQLFDIIMLQLNESLKLKRANSDVPIRVSQKAKENIVNAVIDDLPTISGSLRNSIYETDVRITSLIADALFELEKSGRCDEGLSIKASDI